MGRAIYPHEAEDADFSWLLSNFELSNPDFTVVKHSLLPVVLFRKDAQGDAHLDASPADLEDQALER